VNGFTLYADLLSRVKIVVEAKDLDRAVEIVVENARTGSIGDGKMFVSTIEEGVRVRAGEKGKEAI
jgi:nitrogen regulatory protein P-II 1